VVQTVERHRPHAWLMMGGQRGHVTGTKAIRAMVPPQCLQLAWLNKQFIQTRRCPLEITEPAENKHVTTASSENTPSTPPVPPNTAKPSQTMHQKCSRQKEYNNDFHRKHHKCNAPCTSMNRVPSPLCARVPPAARPPRFTAARRMVAPFRCVLAAFMAATVWCVLHRAERHTMHTRPHNKQTKENKRKGKKNRMHARTHARTRRHQG